MPYLSPELHNLISLMTVMMGVIIAQESLGVLSNWHRLTIYGASATVFINAVVRILAPGSLLSGLVGLVTIVSSLWISVGLILYVHKIKR